MPLHVRSRRFRSVLLACTALPLIATGCMLLEEGLPPGAPRPAPAPLGAAYIPGGNAEFGSNDGVDVINAEAAYLRGATGNGVTVAVIDTGIDAGHPDLDANIAVNSIDITGGGSLDDATGHGTKVAGIIAAERNDAGTHGVAFDAEILAIKAYRCGSSGCNFYMSDLTSAVNYATDNAAHVINMSLGGVSAGDEDLNRAIRRAANAGAFVVVPTGNAGMSEPYYPANLAADPSLGGMVIAVTAVNDYGLSASFANDCGTAMNGCIAAPGVQIATTKDGASSAIQTTSVSGTSFAAPHVSGALALLTQLYPDAYAADPRSIAMFMFDGARDLGAAGVDPVYGHGMLDVAGAIDTADAAIASAAIPLASGATTSLSDSSMVLSPAFGDSLSGLSALENAIAVIRLSDGDHPYRARLDDSIARVPRQSMLESLRVEQNARSVSQPLGNGMAVTMTLADGSGEAAASVPAPGTSGDTLRGLRLAGTLGDGTDLRLGLGVSANAQPAAAPAMRQADALFLAGADTTASIGALAGAGNSLGVARPIGNGTAVALEIFEGETDGLLEDGNGGSATRLAAATVSRGFTDDGTVWLGFGVLDEMSGLLGSQGAGAFTTSAGATTRYAAFGGTAPLANGLAVVGSFTVAATEPGETGNSMLSDWSSVHSNAFSIGLLAGNVLTRGDRLGLLVGQPLRVYDASATLTTPASLSSGGEAVLASDRVDLAPGGREIDVELGYLRSLLPGAELSSFLLLQLEPGHDADAAPAATAGLKLDIEF